ncbi:MAG: type II toxin-antitoxin system Phd/YefM family antitoxin [Verrucomicrobia bacterium]|nr:type II toxin-antitoxin system Phd/YefM family antitoxin [Verrucomicrobiota bacterium]MCH8511752.1 type II toxin-antitoxin system Phd/YefM family antitoxin [Kiritimatiellia bacterium]
MDIKEENSVGISDFKAHCTEHLRRVEQTGASLRVTRHGKVVAVVNPPDDESPTIAEWMGRGAGLSKPGSGALFDEPTWQPGDWDMERDDTEL